MVLTNLRLCPDDLLCKGFFDALGPKDINRVLSERLVSSDASQWFVLVVPVCNAAAVIDDKCRFRKLINQLVEEPAPEIPFVLEAFDLVEFGVIDELLSINEGSGSHVHPVSRRVLSI